MGINPDRKSGRGPSRQPAKAGERVQPSERPADYPAISWQVSRGNFLPSILNEQARSRRLNWFGHVARASPELDHRRALYAAVHGQPRDWKRRRGRPAHTWTRTVEADLRPANIGLFSAWHRAQDR